MFFGGALPLYVGIGKDGIGLNENRRFNSI